MLQTKSYPFVVTPISPATFQQFGADSISFASAWATLVTLMLKHWSIAWSIAKSKVALHVQSISVNRPLPGVVGSPAFSASHPVMWWDGVSLELWSATCLHSCIWTIFGPQSNNCNAFWAKLLDSDRFPGRGFAFSQGQQNWRWSLSGSVRFVGSICSTMFNMFTMFDWRASEGPCEGYW